MKVLTTPAIQGANAVQNQTDDERQQVGVIRDSLRSGLSGHAKCGIDVGQDASEVGE